MTCRSVRPKVLRNLRRLKSGARHSATATEVSVRPVVSVQGKDKSVEPKPAAEDLAIDFTDSKKLFSTFSTAKLLRSLTILQASKSNAVTRLGSLMITSRLMEQPLFSHVVFGFTERTFYNHFCAGRTIETATATAAKLSKFGLSAMLDYGLERADDNESCDSNTEQFIRTIDSTKNRTNAQVSFVVVKMTAICPSHILRRVSDLLRWEYKDSSMNLPWKLKSLPILCAESTFYHTPVKPEALTPEEELDLELAYNRLFKICERSLDANMPLLFDAEETTIQTAIDYMTYAAVVKYGSRGEPPLIFNTIQTYLMDSAERLKIAVEGAEKMGIQLGIKLVRGAYMNSESLEAARRGTNPTIHRTIGGTHACYNHCTDFMLDKIVKGSAAAVLATHNIESGKMAAMKAVNLGIDRRSHCLHFAQLYGMAEALSFGLVNAGFNVSKYLPFGPVEYIMPYLMRRAEENKCVLGASSKDISLMRDEVMRRLTSSVS